MSAETKRENIEKRCNHEVTNNNDWKPKGVSNLNTLWAVYPIYFNQFLKALKPFHDRGLRK